jgi:cysteine desulfurase
MGDPLIKSEYVLYVAVLILIILVLMYFSNSTTNVFKKYKYFDYNGTTPPHKAVVQKMSESAWLGNPSAQYAILAKKALIQAREDLSWWLCSPGQNVGSFMDANYLIFNSGASEGNNQVIRSFVDTTSVSLNTGVIPHIVVTAIEHKTSIDCAKQLAEEGRVEVTFVEPAADGTVDPISVARAINERTVLVSVMHINNETGAMNDIAGISEAVQAVSAQQDAAGRRIAFHVDAVQSIGKMPIPMSALGIDALTMSFHKIYGPAGLGALVLNKALVDQTKFGAQIAGTQNYSLRGGTENVAAIAAIPDTIKLTMGNRERKNARLCAYKDYLVQALLQMPGAQIGSYAQYYGKSDDYDPYAGLAGIGHDVVFLGPTDVNGLPDATRTSPNTLYFSIVKHMPLSKHFCNIDFRDSLFEKHRVVVSIGSACSASKTTSSHVLTAMKAPYIIRCGVVRVSFGDMTTWNDVRTLANAIEHCIRIQSFA